MGRLNPWTITIAPNKRATATASTAISLGCCVGYNGNQVSIAGVDVCGIAMQDALIKDSFAIVTGDEAIGKAGAAIAVGADLASAADGRLVTAAAGQFVIARALEAATAANEYIRIEVDREGKKA